MILPTYFARAHGQMVYLIYENPLFLCIRTGLSSLIRIHLPHQKFWRGDEGAWETVEAIPRFFVFIYLSRILYMVWYRLMTDFQSHKNFQVAMHWQYQSSVHQRAKTWIPKSWHFYTPTDRRGAACIALIPTNIQVVRVIFLHLSFCHFRASLCRFLYESA